MTSKRYALAVSGRVFTAARQAAGGHLAGDLDALSRIEANRVMFALPFSLFRTFFLIPT